MHLIKNEALSAELCISHLHLSSTLSPTSLCVGATISRILRHPNRSERERAIGVWDERTRYLLFYSLLLPKRLNINIIRNWSLQLFMMILFSFPTTNNIFTPMSRRSLLTFSPFLRARSDIDTLSSFMQSFYSVNYLCIEF